jgi:hypothetical protein
MLQRDGCSPGLVENPGWRRDRPAGWGGDGQIEGIEYGRSLDHSVYGATAFALAGRGDWVVYPGT